MLVVLALRCKPLKRRPADAHDAAPSVANHCNIDPVMLMMLALQWQTGEMQTG